MTFLNVLKHYILVNILPHMISVKCLTTVPYNFGKYLSVGGSWGFGTQEDDLMGSEKTQLLIF